MSGRFFLDTNLLVYAIDPAEPDKQKIAIKWLAAAHSAGEGIISYQIVQEWFNVVLLKAAVRLKPDEAVSVYRMLIEPLWQVHSSRELLDTALDLHRHDLVSWWDALVVSAALHGGCDRILTEDLQHGRRIAGLRVQNPFL